MKRFRIRWLRAKRTNTDDANPEYNHHPTSGVVVSTNVGDAWAVFVVLLSNNSFTTVPVDEATFVEWIDP